MTMPMDLFSPSAQPDETQGAAQEWTQVLQDPKVRASMLSMGLQLMQPRSFGQTAGGQLAEAIGAGGETLTNIEGLDRAEREQSRKERETESMGQFREEGIDVKRAGLENQELRTRIAGAEQESKAKLREVQSQVLTANLDKIAAQTEALRVKTILAPGDQQAKIDYQRSQMAYKDALTALAGTRQEAVQTLLPSQVKRNEAAAGRSTTQDNIAMQRLYTEEKMKAQETHRKEQSMLPSKRQTPFSFPSIQEWRATRGTTAPTAAPTTSDSQLPAPPMLPSGLPDEAKLTLGSRYMTPKGPRTWTREGWTQ